MENSPLDILFEKLTQAIANKTLVKLVVSNKRDKSSELKSISANIVKLKVGYCLRLVYRYNTKDITKNYEFDEGVNLLRQSLENEFYNATLFTAYETVALTATPQGKRKLSISKLDCKQSEPDFSHDRTKERLVNSGEVFLYELGITNAKGEVKREMSDKYRQLNRYIELLSPYIDELELPDGFHVVDMGSGKGYLTFALYDFLTKQSKKLSMTGVEYRLELVNTCNEIARKANFSGLQFVQGTIEKAELPHPDILIALHACDTATDEAIYRGIQAGSELIVCAPCCHKQIRRELEPGYPLNSITKFGILKERQAELLTDSLRALIMEVHGYKTNIFEFISTEHTPKNLMIVGKKVAGESPNKQQQLATIAEIKQLYGIRQHYLEHLLGM